MDKQYTFDEVNALIAAGKIKSMTLEATVIRANGDIEPQGIIAAKHRNILKHILLQVRIKLDRLYVYRQRLKNG